MVLSDDMAISKNEWAEIQDRIDKANNSRGWHKVAKWLKDWGLLATAVSVFLALLGIAVTLSNIAFSERDKNQDARTKLARVEQDIVGIKAILAASSVKKDPKQIKEIIADARQRSVRIPEDALTTAAEQFIEAIPEKPEAWDAVQMLVNYRSETTVWRNEVQENIKSRGFPECFAAKPQVSLLGEMTVSTDRKTVTVPPMILKYEYCVIQVDDAKKAEEIITAAKPGITYVFHRCLVRYRGGTVLIPGLYTEAIFEINTPRFSGPALLLAQAILRHPEKTKV